MVDPTDTTTPTTPIAPQAVRITAITQAEPPVVTTATDHGFYTGFAVRMKLPLTAGMQQLDNRVFVITVLSDTTFSLQLTHVPYARNVNSINFDPFVAGTAYANEPPNCFPVGSFPTLSDDPVRQVFVTKIDDATANQSHQTGTQ